MRKLLISVVVLIVIGIVVFGVRTIGARNETDAVDATEAADLVGDGSKAADVEPGERPKPGTYTYVGRGSESVSALGGSEHVFPKQIAVVIELDPENDCVWTANVVYVKQHIEERNYCTENGTVVDRGFTRKTEFFNQTQTTDFECGDDAERLRTDAKPGDTWTWTCTEGSKSKSAYVAKFIGKETLTVGGEDVETWHTKISSKQTGETVGGDSAEYWVTDAGLEVRFSSQLKVTTQSVIGETQFDEKIAYTLTSLVPKDS